VWISPRRGTNFARVFLIVDTVGIGNVDRRVVVDTMYRNGVELLGYFNVDETDGSLYSVDGLLKVG